MPWVFFLIFAKKKLLLASVENLNAASEQKRDAPKCRKTDDGVDDSADHSGLSAEDPCDYIKSEQADASPVDTTDDSKDKSYPVKHQYSTP